MLTTTTIFNNLKLQADLSRILILKIEADTPAKNFYFSDSEFEILDNSTSVTVYGLVSSWGTIEHGVNLFTKALKVGSVTIQLLNAPMKHTGVIEARTIYHLSGSSFIGRTATIYALFSGITDINTDGLIIFKGVIQPPSKVTPDSLTFTIKDSSTKDHAKIPADIFTTDFPTDDSDISQNVDKPYPIVYGSRAVDEDSNGSLFKAEWISPTKLIVSDIPCDAVGNVWIWDSGLNRFSKIDSTEYTIDLDDSGRTTIEFTDVAAVKCWAYFRPKDAETGSPNDIEDIDNVMQMIKVGDQTPLTILNIYTTVSSGSGGAKFYLQDKIGNGLGDITAGSATAYMGIKTDYHAVPAAHFSEAWFIFGELGDMSSHLDISALSSPSAYTELNVGATLNASMTWQDLADDFYFQCGFVCDASGAKVLAFEISEIYVRVQYLVDLDFSSHEIFVSADGRAFGSWIDAVGRTAPAGQDDEGDVIENPAYIIEDILRTDLGIATADINTASFDAAATVLSGWELAFAVDSQINSLSLIENICKLAMLNYYINSQGQHSLIVLGGSYSADDYLYKDDLQNDGFYYQESQTDELINDLDLQFDPHPATGTMRQSVQEAALTSQTANNITIEKIIQADKIVDDGTAADLAAAMGDNTTGFWNNRHYYIYVKMLTWENIHWDIGDIIRLDTSLDAFVYAGLNSWNNTLCMIIGKKLTGKTLEFIMVNVGTAGGGS